MPNIIKTAVNSKDFWRNYRTITVRDGDIETTATVEIIKFGFDQATMMFTMEVGLCYPRRSNRDRISLAVPAGKDGKKIAIQPPDYMLTQADFDAVIKGEVIEVPRLH